MNSEKIDCDIVLINPFDSFYHEKKSQRVPIGLLMLLGVLEEKGYKPKIIDCYAEKISLDQLDLQLGKINCNIFGISGTTNTRFESFAIAKAIKSHFDESVVIYGGVNSTFTWEEVLDNVIDIDIAVKGEGEETIVELMNFLIRKEGKIENIKGISYRNQGEIIDNGNRPFVQDLDALPYPSFHLINCDSYDFDLPYSNKRAGIILSSRGCPAKCDFCSTGFMWGKQFRFKSPKAIADEVEFLIDNYKVEGIKFIDDAMTWNKSKYNEVLDEFLRRKIDFQWVCESRVSSLDKDLIKKMKAMGCIRIGLGVESGSDKILKRIRKGTTVEKVKQVVDWCVETGMKVKAYFIIGHPEETVHDARETIKLIKELRRKGCHAVVSYGTVIFPGTEVETFARKNGLLPRNFSWTLPYHEEKTSKMFGQDPRSPVLIQKQLGIQEIEHLKYMLLKDYWFSKAYIFNNILPRLCSINGAISIIGTLFRYLKHSFKRSLRYFRLT